MKRLLTALLVLVPTLVSAQISIPNTFTPNTRIVSADVNENFAELGDKALNRDGGTMLGPLVLADHATPSITATYNLGSSLLRFATIYGGTLNLSGAIAATTGITTSGGITAGSGTVGIVDSTGKIPAISSTYFASVSGANLTGLLEANIADGTVFPRLAANETITGVWTHSSTAPRITWSETDGGSDAKNWNMVADAGLFQLQLLTDGGSVAATPVYVQRSGTTATAINLDATSVSLTGRYTSATAQPGVLAYNSASDTPGDTADPVDFDTEVYDTANNFSGDTFTAPVTGVYRICAGVTLSRTGTSGAATANIVTSNRSYVLGRIVNGVASTVADGCVDADMDAADTAKITAFQGLETLTIDGSGSPYATWISVRLVP